MAHVDFPRVRISNFDYELSAPDQSVQDSPLTGDTVVFGRGISFWSGSFTFGPFEAEGQRDGFAQVSAFLANLGGYENTFDMPWQGINQAGRFGADDVTMLAKQRASTRSQLQLSVSADPANGVGLRQGDFITINHRLHQCVSNQSDDLVVVTPGKIDATAGAVINWQSPYIRCRANQDMTPVFMVGIDFIEQMRMSWRQYSV